MTQEQRHACLPGADILRCPISHSGLRWLSPGEVEELNERARLGSLRHADDTNVEQPLTLALASADGEFIYRVDEGIFVLLSTRAIRAGPLSTRVAKSELSPETENVKSFYDQLGWRESAEGIFEDAMMFEDLRPVSRDYIRKCHLRLAKHLPARGRYLLDAACGPIQYPEYFTYSASYDFRICVDVSAVALRHARNRLGDKGIYLLCDITNLPLEDGAVDGFVSLHTVYHVPAQRQLKAIDELYRVLKTHGSGVVVYSWGNHSPLMNAAHLDARPLQAIGKMLGAPRSPPRPSEAPRLFGHSHDFTWYRENVQRTYRSSLSSWRSVSVPFLQLFVHEGALGKAFLTVLYSFESWFPRLLGRYGQYPVFVFTKGRRLNRSLRNAELRS